MTTQRKLPQDAVLALLRNDGTAKRAKGPTFTLNVFADHSLLQGPRGKTVKTYVGPPDKSEEEARRHVAQVGGTLAVYRMD